ncbi:MAG: FAD-dependent oxidoreductase [Alphaproteobacteria bacterium]|nr:FAD-dependent oxidoreductase [Alphaproteobacteria bacterium]
MKNHAKVVIIGGGVMGVGLQYHLALEGWTDTLLIEKGELTSGSTWHAAGQVPHFNGSLNTTKIHVYGTKLYPKLPELTGQAVSWHGCGGIRLATNQNEVDWFKYVYGLSRLAGYECEIISPKEILKYHPFINTEGVICGFYTPHDGHVAPADVTNAMAAGVRKMGGEIMCRNRVVDVKLQKNGEWKVFTEKGDVTCEHVVNSAGSYCDVVGSWTGHKVPIVNMLHQYFITEPLKELIDFAPELPVIRDPMSHAYLREENNSILVGPYETSTAHICWNGEPPAWDFESELLPNELDRLLPWLEKAGIRIPLFGESGLKNIVSGAITHTTDGNYLSGPAHGAPNYWMHCGASIGIAQGGGSGKYLAQWMVHGQAEINMREYDPRRFGDWATPDYVKTVAVVDYQHMYTCLPPNHQHDAGRNIRKTGLHDILAAEGAQFGQIFGWERARWYDKNATGAKNTNSSEVYSYKRTNAFPAIREEAKAVRERVGLMDLSTFSKFEITGRDAHKFLERVCANKIASKDGGIVLTHLLNKNGFIESELTVTRLGTDSYYALSAAVAQHYDYDQLTWRKLPSEDVTIKDHTDKYGTLVLAGPRARDTLQPICDTDLSNASFRWLTGKMAKVAGCGVVLLRVNYVGELGWEIHCDMGDMPKIYAALREAGKPHGLALFGTYAMNSLRIEKAYRGWGSELTNEVDMIEASMTRFLRLDKGVDFIGRAATLEREQTGPRMKLVYLELEDGDCDILGNEPLYSGDKLVGITTSGGFGFAVNKSLGFAYVEPDIDVMHHTVHVQMFNERRAARIIPDHGIYDPENLKPRA